MVWLSKKDYFGILATFSVLGFFFFIIFSVLEISVLAVISGVATMILIVLSYKAKRKINQMELQESARERDVTNQDTVNQMEVRVATYQIDVNSSAVDIQNAHIRVSYPASPPQYSATPPQYRATHSTSEASPPLFSTPPPPYSATPPTYLETMLYPTGAPLLVPSTTYPQELDVSIILDPLSRHSTQQNIQAEQNYGTFAANILRSDGMRSTTVLQFSEDGLPSYEAAIATIQHLN
ncbi:hypothetical protein OTU49_008137 [Cherax quadricarinatus]|uniref:Uncharacterized protein n=1 Tax=Cherax quadricarinatus TaxID=27406 RepID=A0AAW0WEZ9_CHEQU